MNKPVFNLNVIRSCNLEKSVEFYRLLGVNFAQHCHENGIEHFASQIRKVTFEIYPQKTAANSTVKTRLGFEVANLEYLVSELQHRGYAYCYSASKVRMGFESGGCRS